MVCFDVEVVALEETVLGIELSLWVEFCHFSPWMLWSKLLWISLCLSEDKFTIEMVFQKIAVGSDPLLTSEHVDVQPLEAKYVVLTSLW